MSKTLSNMIAGVSVAVTLMSLLLIVQLLPGRATELTCASEGHPTPDAPLQEAQIPYATRPESVVLNGENGTLYALTTDGHFHIWQSDQEITCSDERPAGKLTLNPAKNELYLSATSETLVISAQTGEITHRLPFVGDLAVSPLNKRLLIVSGHDVLLIDTDTYQQVGIVPGTYTDNPDLLNYDGTLLQGSDVTDRYPISVVTNVSSSNYWIIFNQMAYGHGGYWGEAWVEALDPVTFEEKWSAKLDPMNRLATDPNTGVIYLMDAGHHDNSFHYLQIYDAQYQPLKSLMMPLSPVLLDSHTQRLYAFDLYFITVIDAVTFEFVDRIPFPRSNTFLAASQGYFLQHTPTELRLISIESLKQPQIKTIETLPLFDEIVLVNNALFLASDDGLLRSVDKGATWQRILPCAGNTSVLPATEQVMFFNCPSTNPYEGEGLFRSTDGGQTWTSINRGLSGLNYELIVVSSKFARDQTIWTRDDLAINNWMVSYDAGNTWQVGTAPTAVTPLQMDITSCSGQQISLHKLPTLYAPPMTLEEIGWVVGSDHMPYHYDAAQKCWTPVPEFQGSDETYWWPTSVTPSLAVVSPQEVFVSLGKIDASTNPYVYISTLYHTTNGGQTWEEMARTTSK